MPAVADQLSLWQDRAHTPQWGDVARGTAHVVDRIEPCDHCLVHWHDGRCDSTPDRYADPMSRGDGTCKRHYIVWPEDVRDGDAIYVDKRTADGHA